MNKHILQKSLAGLCLVMALVLGLGAVLPVNQALAANKVKLEIKDSSAIKLPAQYGTLSYGKGFALSGVYRATIGKITKVHATLSKGGVDRFVFDAKPNNRFYYIQSTKGTNGKSLNETFTFGDLTVGTWKFKMTMTAVYQKETVTRTVIRNFVVAQKVSASGGAYPAEGDELKQWRAFKLAGTYKVNAGKIASVTAAIKTSGGTTKASFSATPNKSSFSIAKDKNSAGKTMNEVLKFGTLTPGSYVFTLTVKGNMNSAWNKKASYSVKRNFVIVKAAKPAEPAEEPSPDDPQTIIKVQENLPKKNAVLKSGVSFSLAANYKVNNGVIKQVKATLTNEGGEKVYVFNAVPDAVNFSSSTTKGTNGKSLNSTMAFATLEGGKYTLKIQVTGDDGASYSVSRNFTIGTPPKIKLSGIIAPTSIKEGNSFVLKGKATVDTGKITGIYAQVTEGGNPVEGFDFYKEVSTTSVEIGTYLNKAFAFKNLPAGDYEYWFLIEAANGTLLAEDYEFSQEFTVVED